MINEDNIHVSGIYSGGGRVPSQSGNYFQPAVSKTLTAVCHSGTTASDRGTFNTSVCPRIPCVPVLGRGWGGGEGRAAVRSKAQDGAFPTSSRWLRRLQVGGDLPCFKARTSAAFPPTHMSRCLDPASPPAAAWNQTCRAGEGKYKR